MNQPFAKNLTIALVSTLTMEPKTLNKRLAKKIVGIYRTFLEELPDTASQQTQHIEDLPQSGGDSSTSRMPNIT